MTLEVYRLNSSRYAANNGRGAALHGGRWNPVGLEVIYAAQSRSLAALEVLVHYSVLPRNFICTAILIPQSIVATIKPGSQLNAGKLPQGPACHTDEQHYGARYIPRYAVFSVPSAIIPQERIYILNPAHADFKQIRFLASEAFRFDPRLKQTATSGSSPAIG